MEVPELSPRLAAIQQPPAFCEYANGKCDQSFEIARRSDVLFLYPNEPALIAIVIEEAAKLLRATAHNALGVPRQWITWKDLGVAGQIIFCELCRAMRFTGLVVADVTTLNFNLMFEIGYALGLGIPVLPIRDTTYVLDDKVFGQIGLIDTIGYLDFQNSGDLAGGVFSRLGQQAILPQAVVVNREQPLFVVKSHIQNEGMIRLMSALKKSGLRFRSFDPRESPRLSIHEAFKQVLSSLGVVVHLVSPSRTGAAVHNSRCALIAGMAMAANKRVLMLQEADSRAEQRQAIDYRDVIRVYSNPKAIPDLLIPLIKNVVGALQESRFVPTALPLTPLEKVDLGDLAAENEISSLRSYFVPTAQYNEAKRGHARLVVGRKGTGKTAVFYGIRAAYWPATSNVVLDLKPEGHQFAKLREAILHQLPPGSQQHVLTAFWNYLLLMEIAHKIVQDERGHSYRDPRIRSAFEAVEAAYASHRVGQTEQADFSERLLALVDDIVGRQSSLFKPLDTEAVTRLVYTRDIRVLSDALTEYLGVSKKEHVWLLFDNLDKGWPVLEAQPEDILLIKSLLEATRKLQRQFERRGVDSHAVVFLRNDIYEHLILDPADSGKDTAVLLDWNDPELFKEIIRRRIVSSTDGEVTFHMD
jgi:nucleoside 2-deoxyribosyltransferase